MRTPRNGEGPSLPHEEPSDQPKQTTPENVSAEPPDGKEPPTESVTEERGRTPTFNVWLNDPLAEVPTVSFYCPHCKHSHTHGLGAARMVIGAYVGHCRPHCDVPESPYEETGYSLRLVGIMPARDETPTRKRRDPLAEWFYEASTVGGDPGPLPSSVRVLGKAKPNMRTLASCAQIRDIVRRVAERIENLFLVAAVPDAHEWRPLCLADSKRLTIAVPAAGALLGSLVSELSLLYVRTLEDAQDTQRNRRQKIEIREAVLAGAMEVAS